MDGQMLQLIHNEGTNQTYTVISKESKILAVYGYDDEIQIWDAKAGELVKYLIGHKNIVSSISFSPDGQYLASGSWDNTIRLWESKEWSLFKVFEGNQHKIAKIVFQPDGLILASTSNDNSIHLWDMSTGKIMKIIKEGQKFVDVKHFLFSPDGLVLARVCPQEILVINLKLEQRTIIKGYDLEKIFGCFYCNNQKLIFFSPYSVYLWDIQKNEEIHCFRKVDHLGKNITALSSNYSKFSIATGKSFILLDLNLNKKIEPIEEHTKEICQVVFIASCGSDGMIKLWNIPFSGDSKNLEIHLCYKTIATYKPLTASYCKIQGASITTKIGWNLKQLFIQKGAIDE